MNVSTNVPWLEADFTEELKFFSKAASFDVIHKHSEDGSTFSDFVSVNGKEYSFSAEKTFSGEIEHKRFLRRYAKLALYRAVADYTGEKQTWGALTGIRPVKYAYSIGSDWRDEMKNEMFVEDRKLDMIADIIEQQKGIYGMHAGECDLFIGIPFCPSRCMYCSFISNEIGKEKRVAEYCDSLVKEINAAKPLIKKLRSVYMGGGTPVSLPPEQLEKILSAIGDPKVEYTVEAGRPDCINESVLTMLNSHGVTRICINPQSFNEKTLRLIGRKHTPQDIIEKYALARKFGFDVNMDLIAGLPGENFEDFKHSVDTAVELEPENITVHTLSIKRGSKLAELTERLDRGDVEKMIDYSVEKLESASYSPYYMYRQKYMAGNLENTGYTKAGKACIYNVDVMEEIADNLACGANGVSKRLLKGGEVIERYGAPKDIKTYIEKIDKIIEEKYDFFK